MYKLVLRKAIFILIPILRIVLLLFFQKKYLTGKYFDSSIQGYIWAIRSIWVRNILRLSSPMPFPVSITCIISNPNNIYFHPDDINNFQGFGNYYQNFKGSIYLGKGCYVAPNVGIITSNHKLNNLDEHDDGRDVILGKECWVGMNSVILPGVILGDKTIVAAGSVVTKSFPEGKVVIGGVPAKIIKSIT